MLIPRAVLLVGLCCTTLVAVSCGDDNSEGIAEVTTTTAAASASDRDGSTTTTAVPEATTTTQAPVASGGADSAEAALRQFIDARGLGQDGRAWDLVLPAQRALLDRDSYFACLSESSVDILGVEVVDQYAERIAVAGVGEQDSMAFTLKITLSSGGQESSDTDTYHAVKENGRWYVFVDDEAFSCAKA